MRAIEYPVSSYDDFFDGLEGFLDIDDLLDLGIGSLSGGAGILLSSAAMPRIPWVKDSTNRMAGATTALGVLGGWLISKLHKQAGFGFAAGTAGLGLAHLIGGLADMNIGLEMRGLPSGMARNLLSPPGLRNAVVEEETLLRKFDNAVVEEETLLKQFDNAFVEEEAGPGTYLT